MIETPRPNTPHDEKRSVKLSLHRIELLRDCYEKHHNLSLVGRVFNVSYNTVKYWVYPNVRKQRIRMVKEQRKEKMKDPVYKARMRNVINKGARELRIRNPDIKEWERCNSRETYHKNRDVILAKKREDYRKSVQA